MSLVIITEHCPQNHKCPAVKECPVDALHQEGVAAPTVDKDKCVECGKCADVCPMGALNLDTKK